MDTPLYRLCNIYVSGLLNTAPDTTSQQKRDSLTRCSVMERKLAYIFLALAVHDNVAF
jgi:hypothetical protein